VKRDLRTGEARTHREPRTVNLEPLSDAEIESIVADAIAAESSAARHEAQPPSSAIVWWRAQMRARQEAAAAINRPLTIAHGVAIACLIGLFATGLGFGLPRVKASLAGLAAIELTSNWIILSMTATIVSIVIASVAALVIFADE
jgi:hypothetical protein